jgi:hypothetical protein
MEEINFSELMEEAGKLFVDAGEYPMYISDSEAKIASTGNPMVVAQCRIEDGPHKGFGPVYNNFVVVKNKKRKEDNAKALAVFFRNMSILGLDEQYFKKNPEMEQIAQDILGKRFVGVLGIDSYDGIERNKITRIKMRLGGPPTVDLDMISGSASAPPHPSTITDPAF